jgi:hypothetical protein
MNVKAKMIAASVAGLFASAAPSVALAAKKANGGKVMCSGVNECKGKGECSSSVSSCNGQNECKGKGVISMTEKDCGAKGGKVVTKK